MSPPFFWWCSSADWSRFRHAAHMKQSVHICFDLLKCRRTGRIVLLGFVQPQCPLLLLMSYIKTEFAAKEFLWHVVQWVQLERIMPVICPKSSECAVWALYNISHCVVSYGHHRVAVNWTQLWMNPEVLSSLEVWLWDIRHITSRLSVFSLLQSCCFVVFCA